MSVGTNEKMFIGITGVVLGWELSEIATLAATCASVATFVFMSVSAIEKIKTLRKKK